MRNVPTEKLKGKYRPFLFLFLSFPVFLLVSLACVLVTISLLVAAFSDAPRNVSGANTSSINHLYLAFLPEIILGGVIFAGGFGAEALRQMFKQRVQTAYEDKVENRLAQLNVCIHLVEKYKDEISIPFFNKGQHSETPSISRKEAKEFIWTKVAYPDDFSSSQLNLAQELKHELRLYLMELPSAERKTTAYETLMTTIFIESETGGIMPTAIPLIQEYLYKHLERLTRHS